MSGRKIQKENYLESWLITSEFCIYWRRNKN